MAVEDDIPLASSAISRLRESVPRLNTATDRAAKLVNEVERLLNEELSVGTDAYATVWSRTCDETGITEFMDLAYRRHNGRYRIVLRGGIDDDPENWRTKPFVECSRDDKLRAIEKMPELLESIAEAVDKRVEKAAATNDQVNEIIKALR